MDTLNNGLKINSFKRKTEALEQIAQTARIALMSCVQPAVAKMLQDILDNAEITNQLYGSSVNSVELMIVD